MKQSWNKRFLWPFNALHRQQNSTKQHKTKAKRNESLKNEMKYNMREDKTNRTIARSR